MGSLCTPTTARATLATFFFFNDTATTEIYTLSLHDALPISQFDEADITDLEAFREAQTVDTEKQGFKLTRSEEHTSELQSRLHLVCRLLLEKKNPTAYSSSSDADRQLISPVTLTSVLKP